MYVKNSNFAIYLVLAALVGFGASFLFNANNSQSDLLSGDISKATRYNNVKEDPEVSALEEKIQNDTAFLHLTKNAYALLENRVENLENLTARTLEVCAGIPELESAIAPVKSLNAKAANTMNSINKAVSGVEKLAEGKKAPEYEQVSNNVFVGFKKIENQLAIGKAFVENATSYINGKSEEESASVAKLIAEWSVYCMQDAVLNNSKSEMEFWGEKLAGFEESVNGFGGAVNGFGGAVNGFGGAVNGFEESVNGFGGAVNGFEGSVNGFEESVNGFGGAVNGFGGAVNGFGGAVNGFGGAVNGFEESVNGFGGAINVVCDIICGFGGAVNGFEESVNGFGGAVNGFGGAVNGFEGSVNGFNNAEN
ncbi:MAG: hypothetical protein MJY69_00935 [Bacteroidales bacterium]|nr:hypothetical protein [Bacteroidales bacterium]